MADQALGLGLEQHMDDADGGRRLAGACVPKLEEKEWQVGMAAKPKLVEPCRSISV